MKTLPIAPSLTWPPTHRESARKVAAKPAQTITFGKKTAIENPEQYVKNIIAQEFSPKEAEMAIIVDNPLYTLNKLPGIKGIMAFAFLHQKIETITYNIAMAMAFSPPSDDMDYKNEFYALIRCGTMKRADVYMQNMINTMAKSIRSNIHKLRPEIPEQKLNQKVRAAGISTDAGDLLLRLSVHESLLSGG